MTSEAAFQKAVETISGQFGLLRAKGFVAVEGKPRRYAMQGVGTRFQGYFDREWTDAETRRTSVVCIGEHDLDWDGIEAAVSSISA